MRVALRIAIGNAEQLYECNCCALSIGVSTYVYHKDENTAFFLLMRSRFFDVCPNTNPTLIGLNVVLGFGSNAGMPWSNRISYLQNVDCVSSLGYEAPLSTGVVYNPTNTPAPGTQTLFDLAGEMTTPASGATFTWVAYASSYEYVVTALSSEANVVTTTEPGGATVTGGVGSEATAGPESGSSGSTTKSAAKSLQPSIPVLVGSFMMLRFYLFL